MRIAIFQTNLRLGGIQRSLLSLLNSDAFTKQEIDLFLFDRVADYDLSVIPSNVSVRYLSRFPKLCRGVPFEVVFLMAKQLAESDDATYDLSIDFDGYSPETACYALRSNAERRVIWAHQDYSERAKYDAKFRLMYRAFCPKFELFDEVVAVSEGVADSLRSMTGIKVASIRIIPNIVSEREMLSRASEPTDTRVDDGRVNVVCVGRLDFAKNPNGALREFAAAAEDNPSLSLYYLGDGVLRDAIERDVAKYGLSERVKLLGVKPNPYPIMAQMDALLLNSRYEGQGIVLREGQALGLKLLFPRCLEKYNVGLEGVDSIAGSLAKLGKRSGRPNGHVLDGYNLGIAEELSKLLRGVIS